MSAQVHRYTGKPGTPALSQHATTGTSASERYGTWKGARLHEVRAAHFIHSVGKMAVRRGRHSTANKAVIEPSAPGTNLMHREDGGCDPGYRRVRGRPSRGGLRGAKRAPEHGGVTADEQVRAREKT